MMRAYLTRDISDGVGTQGVLRLFDGETPVMLDGEGFLYTLENPWLGNARNVSSIPAGEYLCRRVVSPTYGETFEVTGVAGRTHILFHWGNWVRNTQGCVLLGLARDTTVPAVWNSRTAHKHFMAALVGVDEFMLVVTDPGQAGEARP
ncbi:DUF5675 family protein [Pseudodesulfovibrio pelocollis]|uniref:DUF5675 family protein n=1 Tax=Pseudodesulfovibrio pelocollis TaxID=3051432 RepID=UPI00255AC946|nr:DUF5675 family protein [Pseudodesulfovibrio sp. SB368]